MIFNLNRLILLICLFSLSCESISPPFEQKVDAIGLIATGSNELSCDTITLEVNNQIIDRNEFIYGERVTFKFNHIQGFNLFNEEAFPGMSFTIYADGDSLTAMNDVYGAQGVKAPIHIDPTIKLFPFNNFNKQYEIRIKIWDKKGPGELNFKMPFTINQNPNISCEIIAGNIQYDAIYLLDKTTYEVIVGDTVPLDHRLCLMIDGLKGGYVTKNGQVFPGMEIRLDDGNNESLIYKKDVLHNRGDHIGIDSATFFTEFSSSVFGFHSDGEYQNPITLKVHLYDKNPNKKEQVMARMLVKAKMNVAQ